MAILRGENLRSQETCKIFSNHHTHEFRVIDKALAKMHGNEDSVIAGETDGLQGPLISETYIPGSSVFPCRLTDTTYETGNGKLKVLEFHGSLDYVMLGSVI